MEFKFNPIFSLFLLGIAVISGSEVEDDGSFLLQLEHSFDEGRTFEARGTVTVHSLRSSSASSSSSIDQDALSDDQRNKMEKLCDNGGLYMLKIHSSHAPAPPHRTVTDACTLIQSGLKDLLTIHLDWRSQIVGISITSQKPTGVLLGSSMDNFSTRVNIQHMESGPQPDTSAFIQKMEQEKLAKQRGETKDNRSFFSKYWMYIVPVVLVLAMSSASPDAPGGGGGGR